MSYLSFASLHLCVFALIIFSLSCSSKPTDLRTLAPAETLVYLETNDLAAALQPIIDSKPFTEVAKKKPDLASLRGVQLAVAVTGFETSEEKLTDEHSVGRVQPHFVAIADTHTWNYQAVKFAEAKLGGFVAQIYDSEPTLVQSDKNGGKYFVWTAKDGRKAYALVLDSLIYFGNDETAIDKCLAVRRGEADSIAKTGKVNLASQDVLASGYVSTDGIAQIANIVGLQFASQASEESEVQSAIAGILPQLLRNSITDIKWTSIKTEQGIEDKYQIGMPPDIASVFSETMLPSAKANLSLLEALPETAATVTVYNLQNPQLAWRSILLVGQKRTDPLAAKIFESFSSLFFEPYGIANGEMFLSATGQMIVTANVERHEEEHHTVSAYVNDQSLLIKSLRSPILPTRRPYADGLIDIWQSKDGELAADINEGRILLGETDDVLYIFGEQRGSDSIKLVFEALNTTGPATSKTLGRDVATCALVVEMFSDIKYDNAKAESKYFTETRFTKSGMERKTTSDFGFIGAIIAQINQD